MDKNKEDIELLKNNPQKLLGKYQNIIEITVSKFIQRGFFKRDEKMDMVQSINQQMLESKLERIQQHYNGSTYLTTYFSKVVYNACLEIARSNKRKPIILDDSVLSYQADKSAMTEKNLMIEEEINRLEGLLKGIRKKKEKINFCLKLYARKVLEEKDLADYPQTKTEVLQPFFSHYDELNDKEVYKQVIPFFNLMEGKKGDADSLRKWFNMHLDKIIAILNGVPPIYGYDRNTLRILLQYFFDKKA